MNKLNLNYTVKNTRVAINVQDIYGNDREVTYDATLFGLVYGIAVRRMKNWHGMILITGDVGDGKSTLADGICGLDKYFFGSKYTLDNNVFDNEEFNKLCDRMDNFLEPIKYDEAIEGTTGRDVGISAKGISMKKKIIKKRKKKHLYVFCIDELEEYAWKFVKMADAWIHVKSHGLKRGYFDITTNKNKIKEKWLALKNKQYDKSNRIYPDKKNCTFMNYENIFLDDNEYQKKKDEHTSDDREVKTDLEKRNQAIMNMINDGVKIVKIAKYYGLSRSTISDIKAKM